jgi:hypothetical protein
VIVKQKIMGKHRDEWARSLIARLVLVGREISIHLPMKVDTESKVHRGFVDVAWYVDDSIAGKKVYFCVFEIETSKNDWERIRNNSSKLVSLNPLIVCHIFKPGITLKRAEREELRRIHHGRNCYVLNTDRQVKELIKKLGAMFSRKSDMGVFKGIRVKTKTLEPAFKAVDEGLYESAEEFVNILVSEMACRFEGVPVDRYSPCQVCGSHRVYFTSKPQKALCLQCGNIRSFRKSLGVSVEEGSE